MKTELYLRNAVVPALGLLPAGMNSNEARAMILAIGLQESKLTHRLQIGGPARGYSQFERTGGVAGVLQHRATKEHAASFCSALDIDPTRQGVYDAIAYSDILNAGFTRLLLYTLPGWLPGRTNAADGWEQYLAAWRPGKPHPEIWEACFAQAWMAVLK